MAIITNETLQKISDEVKLRNEILKNFADKFAQSPWENVQAIVRAGHAADVYSIGDEFTTSAVFAGTTYEFPWCVAQFKDVELEDGETRPGMVLIAKYATPYGVQFDAAEPDNADANIQKYGYNRWSQSAYRQWLNSAAGVNEWWTAQSDTDVAPNELKTRAGFMASFDSDFLNVLGKTKIQTATNTVTDGGVVDTTYDTFWLPSIEEMYGVPQVSGVEGNYFPYIKAKSGLESPSNSACAERKTYGIDNTANAQGCRLRSSSRSNSCNVWYLVGSTGELTNSYNAGNSNRCAPACVIC